jgi:hypothetical protein
MALKILKFRTMEEANYVLRGGLLGGVIPRVSTGDGVMLGYSGLIGAIITFTSPNDNHTFTQVAGEFPGTISFASVKSQLEAGVTGLAVDIVKGQIGFRHTSLGTNVSLGAVDQPARAILGLANVVTTGYAHTSQFINADGATDPFHVATSASQHGIFVVINE